MISLCIFYELNTEPWIWDLLKKWQGMRPCVRCSTRVWRAVIWTTRKREGRKKEKGKREEIRLAGAQTWFSSFNMKCPAWAQEFIANHFKQFLFKEQDCI